MLGGMLSASHPEQPLLVIDTCAEQASLALLRGEVLLEERWLEERRASVTLLSEVRGMLEAHGLKLSELAGVGVVNGPGSFTGIRVGLATAKGLCEAAGVPLAAVSRLEALAEAAGLRNGFALLSAGRDQVFVRGIGDRSEGMRQAKEWLADRAEVVEAVQGRDVAVATPELQEQMAGAAAHVHLVELSARYAMAAVARCLAAGGSNLARTDANYVRSEEAIYAAKAKPR